MLLPLICQLYIKCHNSLIFYVCFAFHWICFADFIMISGIFHHKKRSFSEISQWVSFKPVNEVDTVEILMIFFGKCLGLLWTENRLYDRYLTGWRSFTNRSYISTDAVKATISFLLLFIKSCVLWCIEWVLCSRIVLMWIQLVDNNKKKSILVHF